MTSVLRRIATPIRTTTEFHRLETPCFYDGSKDVPFPFTYSNGVLDIADRNNFNANMISSTGNSPNTDPDVSVRLLGGSHVVEDLGDNFKAYIRAWRTGSIDANSSIDVYVNGIVQRMQWVDETNMGDNSYEISSTPPSGDAYIQGSYPDYNSTWFFSKPLTVRIYESTAPVYITFTTRFDED
jgi:hypothetical protein